MKRIKKCLAALCVLIIVAAAVPIPVCAAELTTKAQIISAINRCMLKRDTTITIRSKADLIPDLDTALSLTKKALRKDHASRFDDADYLELACDKSNIHYMKYGNSVTVTLTMSWRNTKPQEEYTTKKINAIYKSLKMSKKSEYQRAKAIYTWVIDNVKYDTSMQQNSAYSALKNGTSMCQGYAGVIYRLMLKAGIPCRIVTGTTTGPHAWNAVKIQGNWYFLDAVADDPVYTDGTEYNAAHKIAYDYFLKSLKQFKKDHVLDSRWVSWAKKAKMAETAFEQTRDLGRIPGGIVRKISVSENSLVLKKGERKSIGLSVVPSTAKAYKVSVSGDGISYSNGIVKAKKTGTYHVTIKSTNSTAEKVVTITVM